MSTDDNQIYDGCKFVFASYDYEEKAWTVQPRRFLLAKKDNILIGEFIQSSWFQKQYNVNSQGIFVVLQICKNVFTKTVEKDMNSLKNPFPSLYDIPPYVKRAGYFVMPWQIVNGCIKNIETSNTLSFTLRATNNPWDKLKLSMYKNPNASCENILVTHPSFEIKL
jgi:hypothetical protein